MKKFVFYANEDVLLVLLFKVFQHYKKSYNNDNEKKFYGKVFSYCFEKMVDKDSVFLPLIVKNMLFDDAHKDIVNYILLSPHMKDNVINKDLIAYMKENIGKIKINEDYVKLSKLVAQEAASSSKFSNFIDESKISLNEKMLLKYFLNLLKEFNQEEKNFNIYNHCLLADNLENAEKYKITSIEKKSNKQELINKIIELLKEIHNTIQYNKMLVFLI